MRKWSGICLMVLFLLFSVSSVHAEAPAADNTYESTLKGIRVVFPADWAVYSDEHNSPEQFREHLKNDDENAQETLFLASHPTQQAFARLLYEGFEGSTTDYFDLLYEAHREKVEVLSARYDALNDAVQWTFTVKQGQIELIFVETIAKKGDHVVRLGLWTVTPLLKKHRAAFDEITEKTYFWEKADSREKWAVAWKDIQRNLQGQDIEYVETVRGERIPVPAVVCKPERKNVLWEVKGRKNTLYLFGSIHLGKPDFYPFDRATESSFDRSKHLVVEIDTTSKDVERKMVQFMANARLEEGKSLRDIVSPGVYRKLTEQVDKIGLPTDTFDKLPPWVTAVTLTAIKMQSMGYMTDYGVDRYFLEKAKSVKHIASLETVEEQMALFETIDGEKFLAFTMLSLDSVEVQTEKLVNAWRCGDLQALEDLLFEVNSGLFPGVDEIYEKFFFARNRKMTNTIERFLLDEDNYFVVVGSGHLIGDKGIVALLKKAGYEVNRL